MEEEYKGFTIKIEPDDDPINPREDQNLGVMVCFHRRYDLGDKTEYKENGFTSWESLKKQIIEDHNPVVILPLYMLDHSGITISTTPFSCPWDSGQIGFIYAPRDRVLEYLGVKRITACTRELVQDYLQAEVKTYDTYVRGDFVGWRVLDDGIVEESCWGYDDEDCALFDARAYVDTIVRHREE